MRIALVAPPWYSVPPTAYGGVEMLVGSLADSLVARGHDVLVVAAGRGVTLARSAMTLPEPAEDRLGDEVTSLLHAQLAEEALRRFAPDVVHDHTLPGLVAAAHRGFPTVATVHGPPTGEYGQLLSAAAGAHLVAISRSQQRQAPSLPWADVVPNGVPVRAYPFGDVKDDYLFFLGRMDPDKGVLEAIEVAERSGARLLIAARIHGRQEEQFFQELVRPRLSSTVEFVGEVGFVEKTELLARARALLFPLQWEEPYGLVVAEAQACGTPVLSLRRGAIPELVDDGSTGVLRDHHLELVEAVDRLSDFSAHTCRSHAMASLDISRCVHGYERVFARAQERATSASSRNRVPAVRSADGANPSSSTDRRMARADRSSRLGQLLTKETS